uniref:EamA domain-containing protein n=1 Tax=Pinguiococcus pyrenoidosus TaxID=172671 RepID=A0A7R9YEX8_9STRA
MAASAYAILVAVVLLGPGNFVLYKMMFSSFGDRAAFFVSNAVNFVYVVLGAAALLVAQKASTLSERLQHALLPDFRAREFAIMGLLDGFGTFLTALGAVHTPGPVQTLLNQALLPCTMAASFAFLGRSFGMLQLSGSTLILLGAAAAISPAFQDPSEETVSAATENRWTSNLIYASSNIPIAISAVYKEWAFNNKRVNVFYLTQCVSIWQLFLGFLMGPLQLLPALHQSAMQEDRAGWAEQLLGLASDFGFGLRCSVDSDAPSTSSHQRCGFWPAGFLVLAYCIVNFVFNALGLLLVKKASATLMSISNALILPLTSFAFSFHFLGAYQEPVNAFTVLGLATTLLGFGMYEYGLHRQRERILSMDEGADLLRVAIDAKQKGASLSLDFDEIEGQWVMDADGRKSFLPDAFHERVVGVHHSITGVIPLDRAQAPAEDVR